MHYVSTCSALCERNSNQINNGKTNNLSESPKNDAGSEWIINSIAFSTKLWFRL